MACQSSLVNRLIMPGEVRTWFQPIMHIEDSHIAIYALESLSRGPRGTNIESADVLFEYVRRKRKEDLVDVTCVKSALRVASVLPRFGKLFVNVHASTLAKSQYLVDSLESFCNLFSFAPAKLVVEVIEHCPYWDHGQFVKSTRRLHDMGVQIAVDDLGVAYSSFKVILDTSPEFLKVDMYITQGCSEDRTRRSMIESFLLLAKKIGAELIAEGVENLPDCQTLRSMGVTLFQGYLLAKPQPANKLVHFLESPEYVSEAFGTIFPQERH